MPETQIEALRIGARGVLSAIVTALACAACGGPAPTSDGGLDGGAGLDASTADSGAPDASSDPCIAATVDRWALDNFDDVSIRYRARITPNIGGDRFDLYLEMNRFRDATFEGTFPLGEGPEANFSTCARCVAAFTGSTINHGFFADEGELVLGVDPFSQHLTATFTGVRLVEVTIGGDTLESTPVADGQCLRLEDFTIDRTFPSPGWRCPVEQFSDGSTCHCSCGAYDPDCVPGNPVEGCGEFEICSIDQCLETCDADAGRGCTSGVCGFNWEGQVCITDPTQIDPVATIGASCADGTSLCAVEGGFARGICDRDSRRDGICRSVCQVDDDCDTAALERCYPFAAGYGLCAPRFPTAWTCDGERYEDGASCECTCGAQDPDCLDPAHAISDCGAGEVCLLAPCSDDSCVLTPNTECVPVPDNDVCATAATLSGTTTGTTRGAHDDYTFVAGAGSCIDQEEPGPDVVYQIDLTAGQHIEVVGTPSGFDLALYLLGPGDASVCGATGSECVAGVDAAFFGDPETLSYTATTAGTYYLVVDSRLADWMGELTLELR